MKRLLLGFALINVTLLSAQKFTLVIDGFAKNIKNNQVDYSEVVSNPDQRGIEYSINIIRKLNLQDSTCTFYQFGVYVNTVKIINFHESTTTYEFKMLDYDENNNDVYTHIIITKDSKRAYYYWYNKIQNVTKTEIYTNFTVNIEF
jgi:hypothetical protein